MSAQDFQAIAQGVGAILAGVAALGATVVGAIVGTKAVAAATSRAQAHATSVVVVAADHFQRPPDAGVDTATKASNLRR